VLRDARQSPLPAPVGVHDVDLPVAVALAREGDLPPVGRPDRNALEPSVTRQVPQLHYGHGQAPYSPKERSFLSLLGPRLRYSQRLPYRIPRLIAISCAMAGAAMMLVRLLSLG
jgi:hypothetical protein